MVKTQPVGYSDVPVLLECEDKDCSHCFKKDVVVLVEIYSGLSASATKSACPIALTPMWFSGVKTEDQTVHYREADWDTVTVNNLDLENEINEFALQYGPPVGISVIIQDDEYSLSEISFKGSKHKITAVRNMYKRA